MFDESSPKTGNDLLLVTGATGLVGSHVVQRAVEMGIRTRALLRPESDGRLLREWGVATAVGDLTDPESLAPACEGVTHIVHCAAKVGDWGPVEEYRAPNVRGLENLLAAADRTGALRRFVHISSLGVYPARDHYRTDESQPLQTTGIDGYTRTKIEAEQVIERQVAEQRLPAVILRPGFLYGPRDRTVLPRLLEKLAEGQVRFLGSGHRLMNNTYVGNLVEAVGRALERDEAIGQTYNITDGRLVSKREFLTTVARLADCAPPTRSVPLGVAKALAAVLEGTWKLLGRKEAPLLSQARVKFLGLNLDYSIDKARRELGYQARVDFDEGMRETIDWFRRQEQPAEDGARHAAVADEALAPR